MHGIYMLNMRSCGCLNGKYSKYCVVNLDFDWKVYPLVLKMFIVINFVIFLRSRCTFHDPFLKGSGLRYLLCYWHVVLKEAVQTDKAPIALGP